MSSSDLFGAKRNQASATIERANIARAIQAVLVCHPDHKNEEVRSLRATTIPVTMVPSTSWPMYAYKSTPRPSATCSPMCDNDIITHAAAVRQPETDVL